MNSAAKGSEHTLSATKGQPGEVSSCLRMSNWGKKGTQGEKASWKSTEKEGAEHGEDKSWKVFLGIKRKHGAAEMAQRGRALAAVAEDLGLVSSTRVIGGLQWFVTAGPRF